MILWPHQQYAYDEVTAAIDAGERSMCVTSPTGGGKSLVQRMLLEWAAETGRTAALYTNRKLLTEQTITGLRDHGIQFGVRAAGFSEWENLDAPIQICSLQTEDARVFQSQKWLLHKASLVIVDEAHLQKAETACKIFDLHRKHDAAIVGFTATPLGICHIYDRLIVAGTNSELRDCGALVPCMVHAPTEFDCRALKRQASGEFSINEIRKKIWTPVIFGHVIVHWKLLNPDAKPTLLFAPGVKESAWFASKFDEQGVKAAHIDGEDVWVDGRTYTSSREAREDVLARFKAGEIKILCNRFVLREGIDIPECYHGILACPIGSVTSYVQIVGRILRAHPDTPNVLLTDHGGNFWRHGSPNADRDWASCWTLSDYQIGQARLDKFREKKEPEPIVCPECGAVRMKGAECYKCGHHHDKSVRMVIQKSGNLRPMVGDIFAPRKVDKRSDTEKRWEQIYWRCRKTGKTFGQAYGLFFHENKYWPPKTLALMPTDGFDWKRRVEDVPYDRLVPKAAATEKQERIFA